MNRALGQSGFSDSDWPLPGRLLPTFSSGGVSESESSERRGCPARCFRPRRLSPEPELGSSGNRLPESFRPARSLTLRRGRSLSLSPIPPHSRRGRPGSPGESEWSFCLFGDGSPRPPPVASAQVVRPTSSAAISTADSAGDRSHQNQCGAAKFQSFRSVSHQSRPRQFGAAKFQPF
jgi:hypothetical protein